MFSEVNMMVKKSCINFEKSLKVKYPQISLELLELNCLDEVVGGIIEPIGPIGGINNNKPEIVWESSANASSWEVRVVSAG